MIKLNEKKQLVFTIADRCKTCYTCIRECPAKAISMQNGQANVIPQRCISCGNCVKVCKRKAKSFYNEEYEVLELLKTNTDCIACVAPAFPAEFKEIEDHRIFVGMLKKMGFKKVVEVSFGADLVAEKYKDFLFNSGIRKSISSDCPAIVSYITKYHPHLTGYLAPIVSPLMATARVIKKLYGNNNKIIFIGPCIAKKNESSETDNTLTFKELRGLFDKMEITPDGVFPEDFDPPHSGRGAVFPTSRGLINTINFQENMITGNIIVADGRVNFKEAINEFDNGLIKDYHLELLCCKGCIMGPGMSTEGRRYQNAAYVIDYTQKKLTKINWEEWNRNMNEFLTISLDRHFHQDDSRVKVPTSEEIEAIYISMGKIEKQDRLDCHACGYESCEEHAIAVLRNLAEIDMCLPYNLDKLKNMVTELNIQNSKIESVQQALKQSEKLAHLGQLSAGIAHEINNPLGVVIMYANILLDEADPNSENYSDLRLISEQAMRCKNIVSGLLNFARKNKVSFKSVDIGEFINSCIRAVIIPKGITVQVNNFLSNFNTSIDEEQMTQAITNVIKNAVDAMPEKGKLTIDLQNEKNEVVIKISDTGTGIKEEHMDKLFTPFFTTKEIGQGTGLGLPTTYGIIKMHKGNINVISNSDPEKGKTGTSFILTIPQLNEINNEQIK
ncbi:MAG: ATP-binding protein [Bacteroidales bacterium]|jgi:signal transduction histidine kinase/iron only hydrogenase large subunit-like protein|nr:ATP-binding protein [Bacteroidales bacterium]